MSSKYLKPVRRDEADSIVPRPPSKCGRAACDEDTAILIAACRIGDSPILHGTVGKDRDGKWVFCRKVKTGWADSYDFAFVHWIARCEDCYERETRRAQWQYEQAA